VEHHPGGAIWRSGLYMVGYFVAQLAALSGTVFFVHSLAERFRRAEARRREQAHVAESRERLARIGALSAGVAHTVRNPLHALLSCLEILQRRLGDEDPSVGETLDLMGQGIDRIERVTRRLLALGGEQAEQRSTIDLRDVLDDALSFVDVQARNRGLAIKRELAELPMARVDADRLIDAFSGVLENAVRACEEGDRITLRLIAPGPDGAGPTVEVEDTGCGMSAEVMGRVFDPFFTTRPVGEGTGLGLAITRRVILDHGGRVELESEPERGTMVRIVFPKEILVA